MHHFSHIGVSGGSALFVIVGVILLIIFAARS